MWYFFNILLQLFFSILDLFVVMSVQRFIKIKLTYMVEYIYVCVCVCVCVYAHARECVWTEEK